MTWNLHLTDPSRCLRPLRGTLYAGNVFSTNPDNIAKRRASLTPVEITELLARGKIVRFRRGEGFHCSTVPTVARFLDAIPDPKPPVRAATHDGAAPSRPPAARLRPLACLLERARAWKEHGCGNQTFSRRPSANRRRLLRRCTRCCVLSCRTRRGPTCS